jgi:hypothetical protein
MKRFLNDRTTAPAHHWIILRDDGGVLRQSAGALATKSITYGVILTAACLHFLSLERRTQVNSILHFTPKRKARKSDLWAIRCNWRLDYLDRFSFPLFNQSDVLRAAAYEFFVLSELGQLEWIREAFITIGDPRQLLSPQIAQKEPVPA